MRFGDFGPKWILFCQSRRLSSERDGIWVFQKNMRLKQESHFATFSDKRNAFLILLETFWTLFEWDPMGLNLDA